MYTPGGLIWTEENVCGYAIYRMIVYGEEESPSLSGFIKDSIAGHGLCMIIAVIEDIRYPDQPWTFIINPELIGWSWPIANKTQSHPYEPDEKSSLSYCPPTSELQ